MKSDVKFEEKLTCDLENDVKNLETFYQSSRKSQNWDFDGILFFQNKKCMSLKLTEELLFMKMKSDTKFEEEVTCRFKIVMRSLANFDPSTQKSQKFAL